MRRTARELALKALFQEDVGKQPGSEVVDGVLEQVRTTVNGPIRQIVQETQTEMRAAAASLAAPTSAHASRQIKAVGSACTAQIKALAAHLSGLVRDTVAEVPALTLEAADAGLREAADEARHGLSRAAARDTGYPEAVAQLSDAARQKVGLIETAFRRCIGPAEESARFTVALIHGVAENRAQIDVKLTALATGWGLDRQAAVDRNIMRLAAYEMLHVPDIPAAVSISEAVELAKKYSTAESGRFVNGVLGALAQQVRGTEEVAQ